MEEYARLTGKPELPPLWSFGYQQSHRTLAGREEVLAELKTFREKQLPCDATIYLGTGFCPSGWNTDNGEFGFNQKVFPDPKVMFDQMHADHFKVVLHVAYPTGIPRMEGTVKDKCDPARRAETQPSCYWDMHRPVFALGVDGWWPDEGDALNTPSRLVRNRMYWEAPQLDRPNERPYALHRNAYAGMQRYASFLWSGDVNSQWETLANHVPNAVNTALSGIPYWGTDIGGFVPTAEYDGELFTRWFQFAAFNPLFRSHGRIWPLHLPWGWNVGQPSKETMDETRSYHPDPSVFHNAAVEPICKKYLELRYRMMPYLYSAVRECTQTGMPIIRALWLHYPDDATAVARGDEYLWGRDILVAPVVGERRDIAQALSPARHLARFLDQRTPGRRPRNHAQSGSGNDAALCPRRRDYTDGSGAPIHSARRWMAPRTCKSIPAPMAASCSMMTMALPSSTAKAPGPQSDHLQRRQAYPLVPCRSRLPSTKVQSKRQVHRFPGPQPRDKDMSHISLGPPAVVSPVRRVRTTGLRPVAPDRRNRSQGDAEVQL